MATVVTVRQGTKFAPVYVEMLKDMVREFAGLSLITLTDQEDTPGDTLPLAANLKGWWAKMELFAPWNAEIRPCVFFDLDTYILADIHDLVRDGGESLAMLRDFNSPQIGASGVMIIPRETDVWERFSRRPDMTDPRGDGFMIQKSGYRVLQDEYEGIVSYKKHVKEKRAGRIVCFHGKPKPHEADGWAGEIWRSYAG